MPHKTGVIFSRFLGERREALSQQGARDTREEEKINACSICRLVILYPFEIARPDLLPTYVTKVVDKDDVNVILLPFHLF